MVSTTETENAAITYCQRNGLAFKGYAGGGAFKAVFEVGDHDGKSYALKIVLNPGISPRTKREIESVARCNHQNICKVHKTGTCSINGEDYPFIIEDFLSGGTLSAYCDNNGLLSREQASVIGMNLTDVLAHLKELNLVHRDIKPDNILLRDSIFDPVLVDFGLVRDIRATSLTQTWVLSGPGTPYFASPEQLNNDKSLIDWRSDQFSLGVVISLCYLGIHPYQQNGEPCYSPATVENVALRKQHGAEFVSKAAHEKLPFLIRMTAPWPIERYRDPQELKILFEEINDGCISSNGA
jgi:serine/threonine protein kinase